MRLVIVGVAAFFFASFGGAAHAQITNCAVNGPFINCHTIGGSDNGGQRASDGGFWRAFAAAQEARRLRDAQQSEERRETMIALFRMAQQVNASVPVGASAEESLSYRSAALDRAYGVLRASGMRVRNWDEVKADLLAHPELADQALAALDERRDTSVPVVTLPARSAPAIAATVPVSSPRCTALLRAWDDAMQRGDRTVAQQHQNSLRLECRR